MAFVLEGAKYYIRAINRNVKGGCSSNISDECNANKNFMLLLYKE